MSWFPMTNRGHDDEDARAERFHAALMVPTRPDAPTSDPELDALLEVVQLMAPGIGMGEKDRAEGLMALMASADAAHMIDRRSPTAGSRDIDQTGQGGTPLAHVFDTEGMSRLTLSDVEPIDADRARRAAEEVARLLATRPA